MKNDIAKFVRHLRWEALALAILMLVLIDRSSASLWVIPITFLLFDAGMVGYLKDAKTGALMYNVTHNLTLPTACVAYGIGFDQETVAIIGFLWSFHIAVDRALGYGLKHHTSFHETHLGKIGKKSKN